MRNQLSRFLALMNNYQMSIEATETALNSQGSATRENEKYLDSLEARIQIMKTTWQALAVTMGEAGLTEALKSLLTIATSLATPLSKIIDSVGALPVILFGASAAAATLSSMFRGLVLNLATTVAGLFGIQPAATAATAGIAGLTVATAGFGAVVRTTIYSTGIGLLLSGIIWGVSKLIDGFGNASDETEDLSSSFENLNTKMSETAQLKELGERFEELANKENRTTEESIELSSIQETLSSQYGISTGAINEQTGAIESSTKAINEKIAAMEKETELQREIAQNNFYSQETEIRDNIANLQKQKAEIQAEYAENQAKLDQLKSDIENGNVISVDIASGIGLASELDPNDPKAEEAIQSLKEFYSGLMADLGQEIVDKESELSDLIETSAQSIGIQFDSWAQELETSGMEISDAAHSLLTVLAEIDAEHGLGLEFEDVENFIKTIDTVGIQSVEDFANVMKGLYPNLNIENKLSDVSSRFSELGYTGYDASDSVDDLSSSLGLLDDEASETVEEIKHLNQTLYDLRSGEVLTAEAMLELIEKYPELQNQIQKTADGYLIEEAALEKIRQTKIDQVNSSMTAEAANTDATLANIKSRCVGYGLEIESIKSLAEAKAALLGGINEANQQIVMIESQMAKDDLFGLSNEATTSSMRAGIESYQADVSEMRGIISEIDAYNADLEASLSELNNLGGVSDLISDPLLGVSTNSNSESSSGSNSEKSDAEKAAEEAIKAREEAYNSDVSHFKYLVELQGWSVQEQIAGWKRIAKRHAEYLREDVEAQRSMNLEVKQLIEARYNEEISALDEKVERMRLYNATEVQMEKEKLEKYEEMLKNSYLTEEQRLELQSLIYDTKENIDNARLEETNNYLAKRNEIVEEYDYLLSLSEKRQALLTEGTDEYNQEIAVQNELKNKQIEFYEQEIAWIEERLKGNDLTQDQIDALIEQQKEYQSALLDTYQVQRDTATEIANEVVSLITEAYEEARDAAIEAIEAEMEAEEERHENRIDNLNAEKEAFDEIVDAKIAELKREKEEEDYEKELATLQEEQAEIQAELNKYLLDDSAYGNKKRAELEEKLADKIEEIQEFQNDRQYELREENLEELKDQKAEEIESAIDTEDALHEILSESLETKKEQQEEYWNNILENEQYFTQLTEAIISGSLENTEEMFGTFKDTVVSQMTNVGSAIQTSVIEKLNQAQQLLSSMSYTSIYSSISTSGTTSTKETTSSSSFVDPFGVGMSESEFMTYLNNKYLWSVGTADQKAEAALENAAIRSKYGIASDLYSYDELKNLASLDTGGRLPAWGSSGKFLLAHEKELVLKPDDADKFLMAVNLSKDIVDVASKLKNTPAVNNQTTTTTSGVTNAYLNFYNNVTGDEEGGKKVFSTVIDGLKKLGIAF